MVGCPERIDADLFGSISGLSRKFPRTFMAVALAYSDFRGESIIPLLCPNSTELRLQCLVLCWPAGAVPSRSRRPGPWLPSRALGGNAGRVYTSDLAFRSPFLQACEIGRAHV